MEDTNFLTLNFLKMTFVKCFLIVIDHKFKQTKTIITQEEIPRWRCILKVSPLKGQEMGCQSSVVKSATMFFLTINIL